MPSRQGHALAEIVFHRVAQGGLGHQFAVAALGRPVEQVRQALPAGFARRILDRPAVPADLELEDAARRAGGQAERIRLRGAGGSIGALVRRTGFLRFGLVSGFATAQSPAARMAAAEQRPRS